MEQMQANHFNHLHKRWCVIKLAVQAPAELCPLTAALQSNIIRDLLCFSASSGALSSEESTICIFGEAEKLSGSWGRSQSKGTTHENSRLASRFEFLFDK